MKRFAILIITVCFLLVFTACEGEPAEPDPETKAAAVFEELTKAEGVTDLTVTGYTETTQPYITETTGQSAVEESELPTETAAPVMAEEAEQARYCTLSIECSAALASENADPAVIAILPENGVILDRVDVTFEEGESVFDVLQRVCRENGVQLESSWTPVYSSAYVEGIANLYEFDCGSLSGWMYSVNGEYPNYGCSKYYLSDGDVVAWRYTCDLGGDIGGRNTYD